MQVIPVIDTKDGLAVHARRGERAAYAPIESRLCAGARPLDLLHGYLRLFPFSGVYLADLDAIAGAPPDLALYRAILQAAPDIELWVDCGVRDAEQAEALLAACAASLVLGSESLRDAAVLEALAGHGERLVLSLDFQGERFLGAPGILEASRHWPARLAVMTLARVGSGLGPDLARLAEIQVKAGARRLYAAGGVGSVADLHELARFGCAGALVASVLHDGRVQGSDLQGLMPVTP